MLSNPHHFSYFVPANLANPQAQSAELASSGVRQPFTTFAQPIVVQDELRTGESSDTPNKLIQESVEKFASDLVGDLKNSPPTIRETIRQPLLPQSAAIPFRQQSSGAYDLNINYGAQKRNFETASKPQRVTAYDFTATGTIHKANPEAIKKVVETAKLLTEIEEAVEKQVVAKVTELTEQHQKEQKQLQEQTE